MCQPFFPTSPESQRPRVTLNYLANVKLGTNGQFDNGDRKQVIFAPDLLLLNVQSLNYDKIDDLMLDVNDYPSLNFLCLTEIGNQPNLIEQISINGFSLSNYYCRQAFKSGGVGIWVNDKLHRNHIISSIDLQSFCIEKHFEACTVSITSNIKGGLNLLILSCYRSPS